MPYFCERLFTRHGPATKLFQATAPVKAAANAPTHEEIARLAYSYWEARGWQGGSSLDDWFRAELELKERNQA
jgi:Protein of unknown function (DUF2934)